MQNAECSCVHLCIRQPALDILPFHVANRTIDAAVTFEQIDQSCIGHHDSAFMNVSTLCGELTCRARPAVAALRSAASICRLTAALRRAVLRFDQPHERDVITRHSDSAPSANTCEKSTDGRRA